MNQIKTEKQKQESNNYQKIVFKVLQTKLFENLDFLKKICQLAQFKNFSSAQKKQNNYFSDLFHLIVNIQKMSSLANQVYKITFLNQKKIICKVYHNILQEFTNKTLEQIIVKTMSQQKQYPQIYFSDDFCRFEGFIQGKTITYKELTKQILQKIVLKLSNFKKKCQSILLKVNESSVEPQRNIRHLFGIFKRIYQIKLDQCPQLIQKAKFLIAEVLSQQVLFKIQKNILPVFIASHNDCNLSNILLTKSEKFDVDIVLIDFQFSDLNYIGFDIGNFFNELATDYDKSFQIREQLELQLQIKQKLIHLYFSELSLTQEERELCLKNKQKLSQIVDSGRMMSHLYWMFVGLKQINDPNIQLDMNYYIKRRYQQFFKFYSKLK